MRVLKDRPVSVILVSVAILLTFVYAGLRIPSTEGFNPSDDGVILAQSYRILAGEVPHRDFISIRPAGSAYMHLVNFFSPLPLELSARWLVLIEYFLTSLLLVLFLVGSWFRGLPGKVFAWLTAGSVVIVFILNQNHYNLFPWTTTDALFWFSVALYGWYRIKTNPEGHRATWQILVLAGISLAVLCRQTFALPGLVLALRMITWGIAESGEHRAKKILRLLPVIFVGLAPAWLYAGMLTVTGAWPDFFQQLTGRTELWDTGVVTFWHSFWHSPVAALFILATLSGLIRVWIVEAGRDSHSLDFAILLQKFISFGVKILLVFLVFVKPALLFQISLAFFWLLVLDIFLIYIHSQQLPRWVRPAFWILLVAWTSAVSLGDNAPVFALGWLAGAAILMQIKDFRDHIYRKRKVYHLMAAVVFIPAILVLSLIVQRGVNYRDLPANQLTARGGDIFAGLEGVDLSPAIADYLKEIKSLYQEYGKPQGRFVVWPNNALIYALLGSPNPFPLDWMQSAEFVGSEKRMEASIRNMLASKNLLILVERINVKWMSTVSIPVHSAQPEYPYLHLLDSMAIPVSTQSQYFKVYRTQ